MNSRHGTFEPFCQVSCAQMQIQKSGLEALVAGKVGDILQIPSSSREVCQAEVPESVGAEFRQLSPKRDTANHFGPSPLRDGLACIAVRVRNKQPTRYTCEPVPLL